MGSHIPQTLSLLCLCSVLIQSQIAFSREDTEEEVAADSDVRYTYIKAVETLLSLYDEGADPEWSLLEMVQHFKKKEIAEDFAKLMEEGMLAKGEYFNMRDPKTREETVKMFKLFQSAKDFDTMNKVAVKIRPKVNYHQFVHAFSSALLWREDTKVELPAWYEVFPNYFLPADKLQQLKAAREQGNDSVTVDYSWDETEEDEIAYLREDVELNSLYQNWFLHYPNWMSSEDVEDDPSRRWGELFYYTHRQILARYYLELAAGGDAVQHHLQPIRWNETLQGYDPKLVYENGEPFSKRAEGLIPEKSEPLGDQMVDSEYKIFADIKEGEYHLDVNNMIEMDRYWGIDSIGRMFYSLNFTSYYRPPWFDIGVELLSTMGSQQKGKTAQGAIGSPMTALRDPAYYRFISIMVKSVELFKQLHLEPYVPFNWTSYPFSIGNETLEDNSVEVSSVSDLATFFDYHEYDVTNGVETASEGRLSGRRYKARQKRLAHRPFNYTVKVTSGRSEGGSAVLRLYLGPRLEYLTADPETAKALLLEIDRFPISLKKGVNVVERNCGQLTAFAEEPETFFAKYSRLKENFFKDNENETYHKTVRFCGLPNRLVLPKGGPGEGRPYTLVAVVTPGHPPPGNPTEGDLKRRFDNPIMCGPWAGDYLPMGFPFDRSLRDSGLPQGGFIHYKEVLIRHQD